jgi:hypothetical protein
MGGKGRKIIYLITGVGNPSDVGTDRPLHLIHDNSTEYTGMLMKAFIEQEYKGVEVICVHSTTNLFRYDENIVFVKNNLMPRIELLRDALAEKFGSRWKSLLHVTMSFADGSSARINSINAALRIYKPHYFHFWQLKTFWHQVIFLIPFIIFTLSIYISIMYYLYCKMYNV